MSLNTREKVDIQLAVMAALSLSDAAVLVNHMYMDENSNAVVKGALRITINIIKEEESKAWLEVLELALRFNVGKTPALSEVLAQQGNSPPSQGL